MTLSIRMLQTMMITVVFGAVAMSSVRGGAQALQLGDLTRRAFGMSTPGIRFRMMLDSSTITALESVIPSDKMDAFLAELVKGELNECQTQMMAQSSKLGEITTALADLKEIALNGTGYAKLCAEKMDNLVVSFVGDVCTTLAGGFNFAGRLVFYIPYMVPIFFVLVLIGGIREDQARKLKIDGVETIKNAGKSIGVKLACLVIFVIASPIGKFIMALATCAFKRGKWNALWATPSPIARATAGGPQNTPHAVYEDDKDSLPTYEEAETATGEASAPAQNRPSDDVAREPMRKIRDAGYLVAREESFKKLKDQLRHTSLPSENNQ